MAFAASQPFEWVEIEVAPGMGVEEVHQLIVSHVVRFLRKHSKSDGESSLSASLTGGNGNISETAGRNSPLAVTLGPLNDLW